MARKRPGKPVHGVIILDKPRGITSNAALQKVKQKLGAAKAGHTGALDPVATGVLPLCFGEATKFSQILLEADKEYVTKAHLGVQTSTADCEGEVLVSKSVPDDLDLVALDHQLDKFRGAQKQVPSMYSALKHNGIPLYKLARRGVEVERKARDINVYELTIIGFDRPFLELKVRCSKGTYIRNLVEDIGFMIGCGAHVAELRRVCSGPYCLQDAVALTVFEQELSEPELRQLMHPVDSAVAQFGKISLNVAQSGSLILGQTVKISALEKSLAPGMPLRLYSENEARFLGLGVLNPANELKSIRLLNPGLL